MSRRRIHVPASIKEKIREQMLYIAQDSVDHATAWEGRVMAAIDDLADMPKRFPVHHPLSERLGDEVRKMTFEGTYLVFYHLLENGDVMVINFRHGAQLPHWRDL